MEILELAYTDGLNPKKVAATNGGEYHSPCPACGGKDRFIIWDIKNRYYCRRCRKTGDPIQYLRDFHNLSFKEACLETGKIIKPKSSYNSKKEIIFKPLKSTLSNSEWLDNATLFINRCCQNLLNTSSAIDMLQKRGFTLNSINEFKLGWNPTTSWTMWANKKTWLPKGIVIPSFQNNQLCKIKIRKSDWNNKENLPKYIEVHGSMSGPIISNPCSNLPIILLESELDALIVQQEAKNLCSTIALGGATKKPNSYIHFYLLKSHLILFSLDYDDAGIKAYKWWKNQYKNLYVWPTPIEKSAGDAFVRGFDIKRWISLGITEYLKIGTNKEGYDNKKTISC